jgi:hypothetical protein
VTGPDSSSEHTRIIRRVPSDLPTPPSGTSQEEPKTGIIRRTPTGSIPAQQPPDETRTGIIRRTPTGSIPAQQPPEPRTTHIPAPRSPQAQSDAPTGLISVPPAQPTVDPEPTAPPVGAVSAIATCAVAMLSGWAVSVVATDLVTGWWQSDRLFCLGVGFLTFVFAASTISGVITLLLQRTIGRYLIATGALVALLTFGSVFIAGAKIAWPVYLIPVLPVLSVALAFLPGTGRWSRLR